MPYLCWADLTTCTPFPIHVFSDVALVHKPSTLSTVYPFPQYPCSAAGTAAHALCSLLSNKTEAYLKRGVTVPPASCCMYLSYICRTYRIYAKTHSKGPPPTAPPPPQKASFVYSERLE